MLGHRLATFIRVLFGQPTSQMGWGENHARASLDRGLRYSVGVEIMHAHTISVRVGRRVNVYGATERVPRSD